MKGLKVRAGVRAEQNTDFARADRPPVLIPFFAFRIMVGMGLVMLAISWVGLWLRWRGRLAAVELDELAGIEGFDEDLAQELQSRAQEALDRREQAAREERQALGVEDALADMPHLTEAMLVTLGKAGVKTLDDLRHAPTTQKSDLRDNYPFGLFAVPQEQDGCRQAPTVEAGGIAGVNGIETVMKRIGHREARRAKYRCPMRST